MSRFKNFMLKHLTVWLALVVGFSVGTIVIATLYGLPKIQDNMWLNFWQVAGSLVGVLGALYVVRKEIRNSDTQLEKQLNQERAQHEQTLKHEKIQHDSELLLTYDNVIDELNAKRLDLVREIRRLQQNENIIKQQNAEQNSLIIVDSLEYNPDKHDRDKENLTVYFKDFLQSYKSVVKNTLIIIRIVKRGEYENYSDQIQNVADIHTNLSTSTFSDTDNEGEWGEDVLVHTGDNSKLGIQLNTIKATINDTLDELLK